MGCRITAIVNEFDPVYISTLARGIAPPFKTFVADDGRFHADFQVLWQHEACANWIGHHGFNCKRLVYNLSRVICHTRNNCDIWLQKVQVDCGRVYSHDGTLTGQTCRFINQRGHATGHGVAFKTFITPANNVARYIFCGEVVAIVPLNTFSDFQYILRRIGVCFPAGQQHWSE